MTHRSAVSKKSGTGMVIAFVVIAAVLTLMWVGRDLYLRGHQRIDCGDGPRFAIDLRSFEAEYSKYSIELQASVEGKGDLSLHLRPVQMQQLSEAMQSSNEFRKYVVAGYNACAISKAQYAALGSRLQALDNSAREINQLLSRKRRNSQDDKELGRLIFEYDQLAKSATKD